MSRAARHDRATAGCDQMVWRTQSALPVNAWRRRVRCQVLPRLYTPGGFFGTPPPSPPPMSGGEVGNWLATGAAGTTTGLWITSQRQQTPGQAGCARQDSNLHALAGTRT
jgi:hypothetical protein